MEPTLGKEPVADTCVATPYSVGGAAASAAGTFGRRRSEVASGAL